MQARDKFMKCATTQSRRRRALPPDHPRAAGGSWTDDAEVVEWNKTISAHMRTGRTDAARRLFLDMPRRNTVTWNAMISGYFANHLPDLASRLFRDMPCKNLVSYNVMISGCIRRRDLGAARKLFDEMPVKNVVTWNSMLSGYAHLGYVEEARGVFDRMPVRDSISWNGVLAAYIQNGRFEAARELFQSNSQWDKVSWNAMMSAYVQKKRLGEARLLFDRMPERDAVSWNIMISGYAQNGELLEARRLFDECPKRDVFAWTAMVSGLAKNGLVDEARRVFDEMPERNEVSWNSMISGYVLGKRLDCAKELFDRMPAPNVSSWNTMITGYAQSGDLEQAGRLFDQMPTRDSISWAALIAGYAQGGRSEEALRLFVEMERSGERMNRSSFTCALSTCADIAALEFGKQVHGRMVKAGYENGCFVGNALLAMYCKCGSIDEAYGVFEGMHTKDTVTWNTMIAGYSRHGFGKKALSVFESMSLTGVVPDGVTMVAVLSACSHAGLIQKGIDLFYAMNESYNITAKPEHYTCMIDLLGRCGRLEEAKALMKNLPFEPDATMWGALLGASRIYGNTSLGEEAAKKVFEMEPDNAGMYVLLSNLYASSGRWRDVGTMRKFMKERGVTKVPGFSWIEVLNKIHTFSVGDSIHPEREKIYAFLEELELKLRKAGYTSATKIVLHDVEEEEKEQMLMYHSEKMAVAFGILNVPPGRPIRVIKNLRVCQDCHNAIKHISKFYGRLIILRDSNRFHHFEGGSCSCGDYW